jgi:predicted nucleotidyltransferase component of viral defense system
MICVSDYPVALANKLAAWNERRLMRDLYDVWFFLQMGVSPDVKTLESRLRKPEYSRLVRKSDRFPGKRADEFYDFLRDRVASLSDSDIRDELADYLTPEETEGLAMQIKAALAVLQS